MMQSPWKPMINHGENSETRIHVLQDSKKVKRDLPGALALDAGGRVDY